MVPSAPSASSVTSAGRVSAGGVVSCTVTSKLLVPVLPWVSVALQLTVVVPIGNREPESGAQLVVTSPSTRSAALAAKVAAAPSTAVASAVRSAGTVTSGGVVSCTSTEKDPLARLPAPSLAQQVIVVV